MLSGRLTAARARVSGLEQMSCTGSGSVCGSLRAKQAKGGDKMEWNIFFFGRKSRNERPQGYGVVHFTFPSRATFDTYKCFVWESRQPPTLRLTFSDHFVLYSLFSRGIRISEIYHTLNVIGTVLKCIQRLQFAYENIKECFIFSGKHFDFMDKRIKYRLMWSTVAGPWGCLLFIFSSFTVGPWLIVFP